MKRDKLVSIACERITKMVDAYLWLWERKKEVNVVLKEGRWDDWYAENVPRNIQEYITSVMYDFIRENDSLYTPRQMIDIILSE